MIQVKETANSLSVRMVVGLKSIEEACDAVAAFMQERGLDQDRFETSLVVREALSNAILHAGRDIQASLDLEISGDMATMVIEDDGPGFDWRSLRPSLPPGDKTSGRGLFIIHSYACEVTYNDKGNKVTIKKNLSSSQGEGA